MFLNSAFNTLKDKLTGSFTDLKNQKDCCEEPIILGALVKIDTSSISSESFSSISTLRSSIDEERRMREPKDAKMPKLIMKVPMSLDPNLGLIGVLPPVNIPYEARMNQPWNIAPYFLDFLSQSPGCDLSDCILLFGGLNPNQPNDFVLGSSVFEYHVGFKKWRYYGCMMEPRCYHATCQTDSFVYVTGGYSPILRSNGEMIAVASTDRLDITNAMWMHCADMKIARAAHAMVAIDEYLYVFGGRDSSGSILTSIEVYNPYEDTWREVSKLPRPLMGLSATFIKDRVWLMGGITTLKVEAQEHSIVADVYSFSPFNQSWNLEPPLPVPHAFSPCASSPDKIWITGGCHVPKNVGLVDKTLISCPCVFRLSIKSRNRTWKMFGSLSHPTHACSTILCGEYLYVIGGMHSEDQSVSDEIQIFNTSSKMPEPSLKIPAKITGASALYFTRESQDSKSSKKHRIPTPQGPQMDVHGHYQAAPSTSSSARSSPSEDSDSLRSRYEPVKRASVGKVPSLKKTGSDDLNKQPGLKTPFRDVEPLTNLDARNIPFRESTNRFPEDQRPLSKRGKGFGEPVVCSDKHPEHLDHLLDSEGKYIKDPIKVLKDSPKETDVHKGDLDQIKVEPKRISHFEAATEDPEKFPDGQETLDPKFKYIEDSTKTPTFSPKDLDQGPSKSKNKYAKDVPEDDAQLPETKQHLDPSRPIKDTIKEIGIPTENFNRQPLTPKVTLSRGTIKETVMPPKDLAQLPEDQRPSSKPLIEAAEKTDLPPNTLDLQPSDPQSQYLEILIKGESPENQKPIDPRSGFFKDSSKATDFLPDDSDQLPLDPKSKYFKDPNKEIGTLPENQQTVDPTIKYMKDSIKDDGSVLDGSRYFDPRNKFFTDASKGPNMHPKDLEQQPGDTKGKYFGDPRSKVVPDDQYLSPKSKYKKGPIEDTEMYPDEGSDSRYNTLKYPTTKSETFPDNLDQQPRGKYFKDRPDVAGILPEDQPFSDPRKYAKSPDKREMFPENDQYLDPRSKYFRVPFKGDTALPEDQHHYQRPILDPRMEYFKDPNKGADQSLDSRRPGKYVIKGTGFFPEDSDQRTFYPKNKYSGYPSKGTKMCFEDHQYLDPRFSPFKDTFLEVVDQRNLDPSSRYFEPPTKDTAIDPQVLDPSSRYFKDPTMHADPEDQDQQFLDPRSPYARKPTKRTDIYPDSLLPQSLDPRFKYFKNHPRGTGLYPEDQQFLDSKRRHFKDQIKDPKIPSEALPQQMSDLRTKDASKYAEALDKQPSHISETYMFINDDTLDSNMHGESCGTSFYMDSHHMDTPMVSMRQINEITPSYIYFTRPHIANGTQYVTTIEIPLNGQKIYGTHGPGKVSLEKQIYKPFEIHVSGAVPSDEVDNNKFKLYSPPSKWKERSNKQKASDPFNS